MSLLRMPGPALSDYAIILYIKIQESEEDMANKDVTDRYAKNTALVLRLKKKLYVETWYVLHWLEGVERQRDGV